MKKIIISLFILINLFGCGTTTVTIPFSNSTDNKTLNEDILKKYIVEKTDLIEINTYNDLIQKIKFNDGINCIIYRQHQMSGEGGISCVVLKD